jgi:3'-phosphoadenosine 5'-phosphosulfate sulfotransferase (PAPS reductase)/FAD synthetase
MAGRIRIRHYVLRKCRPLIQQPFEEKLTTTQQTIQSFIEKFGNDCCVAWSGGKASSLVLKLCLDFKPDIKVLFCNTRVEYPEIYQYIQEKRREWRLNYHETVPKKTFWQCVKGYGFPELRGSNHKARTPKCCYYLKEKPALDFYRKNGIKAVFTGLQAMESRNRMLLASFRGMSYFSKCQQLWKIHPILF